VQEYLKDSAVKSLEFYQDYASLDRGFIVKVSCE
jgi:hypothetical protein